MMLNNLAIDGESDENLHMIIVDPFPPGLFPFPLPPQMPVRNVLYFATLAFSGIGQWLGSPEAPLNSWDDLLMAYVDGSCRYAHLRRGQQRRPQHGRSRLGRRRGEEWRLCEGADREGALQGHQGRAELRHHRAVAGARCQRRAHGRHGVLSPTGPPTST